MGIVFVALCVLVIIVFIIAVWIGILHHNSYQQGGKTYAEVARNKRGCERRNSITVVYSSQKPFHQNADGTGNRNIQMPKRFQPLWNRARSNSNYAEFDFHGMSCVEVEDLLPYVLQNLFTTHARVVSIGVGRGGGILEEAVRYYLDVNQSKYKYTFDDDKKIFSVRRC